MIALDSSIVVGLVKGEPDLGHLVDTLPRERVALAAPTVVEIRAWVARRLRGGRSEFVENLLASPETVISPFTAAMAEEASRAFALYGRGSGSPANLNFGDALVYGHTKILGLPLLFKGGDFNHTDLALDPRSVALA